jgi:Tfp pilus assembly protein PilF
MEDMAARLRQRDFGVARCRQDRWEDALPWLAGAFADGFPNGSEWAVAASYLGYCLARVERRREEGAKLCRHALKAAIFHSEIWANLARIHLLANQRGPAVAALDKGLGYDPDDTELGHLRRQLGKRRGPPIRFLARSHFLNRALGKLRHHIVR